MITERDRKVLRARVESRDHNPVCEDDLINSTDLRNLLDENDAFIAALKECAQASYLDEHDLEFKPTREALVAQRALAHIKPSHGSE